MSDLSQWRTSQPLQPNNREMPIAIIIVDRPFMVAMKWDRRMKVTC